MAVIVICGLLQPDVTPLADITFAVKYFIAKKDEQN